MEKPIAIKAATFMLISLFAANPTLFANHIFVDSCAVQFLKDRAHTKDRATHLSVSPEEFEGVQGLMRREYEMIVIPDMRRNPSPYTALPKGIRPDLVQPMEELWNLGKHRTKYFELMQEFEREVVARSQRTGLSLEEAFLQELLTQESYFGFLQPITVTKYETNSQFLYWISQGHPVADEYYRGKSHTVHGHRVQSILQAKYLERLFGDRTLYLRLYSYMGEEKHLANFDWSGTGIDLNRPKHPSDTEYIDLYGYLYDTPFHSRTHRAEPSDYSNLEFFSGLRIFLPGLVGWD